MSKTEENPRYEVANGEATSRTLLVCDHASSHVPPELDNLGLDESLLRRHIAYDIGAADITRRLAVLLDCPAVLCGTSRLVVDCNRPHDDPTSMPPVSDGVRIPGNAAISASERQRRIDAYFWPYHHVIEGRLKAMLDAGTVPALVSIHSFTPVFDGFERPWHVAMLSNRDRRLTEPLLVELARDPAIVVGDNEPYSGWDPSAYALREYGVGMGIPHAVFEIRQDLIDTHHGAEAWAYRLAAALRPVLQDASHYHVLRSTDGDF